MSHRRRDAALQYNPAGEWSPLDLGSALVAWWRADKSVTTVMTSVSASGTSPPTVTLSGTADQALVQTVEIDCTTSGTNLVGVFQWKLNTVVQQTGITIPLASQPFSLGSTGLSATFATGTYTNNNVYTSTLVVSAIADLSGNGHSLLQATAAQQPFYVGGALPYLSFPGSTAGYNLQTAATLIANQPMEFFASARSTQNNPTTGAYLWDNGTNNDICAQSASGNVLNQYNGGTAGNGVTITVNADFIVDSYYSGASSQQALNGGVAVSGTNPGAGASAGKLTVGNSSGSATCWGGRWYEMFAVNAAMSAANRILANRYMGRRPNGPQVVVP